MKSLRLMRPDSVSSRFVDAQKIVNAFSARGYEISHHDAIDAWRQYSQSSSHTWLPVRGLGADDLFARLMPRFEEWSPPDDRPWNF